MSSSTDPHDLRGAHHNPTHMHRDSASTPSDSVPLQQAPLRQASLIEFQARAIVLRSLEMESKLTRVEFDRLRKDLADRHLRLDGPKQKLAEIAHDLNEVRTEICRLKTQKRNLKDKKSTTVEQKWIKEKQLLALRSAKKVEEKKARKLEQDVKAAHTRVDLMKANLLEEITPAKARVKDVIRHLTTYRSQPYKPEPDHAATHQEEYRQQNRQVADLLKTYKEILHPRWTAGASSEITLRTPTPPPPPTG